MLKKIMIVLVISFTFFGFTWVDQLSASKDTWPTTEDISSSGFEIRTGDLFPWAKPADKWSVTANTNFYLSKIIQMLMILLGSASLLIMTVWAGYMIMYHGQDELLSKGKSIFTAGIIALVVAGSSYYLVSAMRFLLFQ